MLAALLKWPQATFASKVEFDKAAGSVKVSRRSCGKGRELCGMSADMFVMCVLKDSWRSVCVVMLRSASQACTETSSSRRQLSNQLLLTVATACVVDSLPSIMGGAPSLCLCRSHGR